MGAPYRDSSRTPLPLRPGSNFPANAPFIVANVKPSIHDGNHAAAAAHPGGDVHETQIGVPEELKDPANLFWRQVTTTGAPAAHTASLSAFVHSEEKNWSHRSSFGRCLLSHSMQQN